MKSVEPLHVWEWVKTEHEIEREDQGRQEGGQEVFSVAVHVGVAKIARKGQGMVGTGQPRYFEEDHFGEEGEIP